MRARFLFRWMIVAVALACFGACASPSKNNPAPVEPQPVVQPPPPPSPDAQTGDEPTDETIGFQIRRLLNTDPTTGVGIIVEVDDGHVTLRGKAITQAVAWRAEGVAHSVKGVKSVVNQILVETPTAAP